MRNKNRRKVTYFYSYDPQNFLVMFIYYLGYLDLPFLVISLVNMEQSGDQ